MEDSSESKSIAVIPPRATAVPQVLDPVLDVPEIDQRMGVRDYARILKHHLWLAAGLPLIMTTLITFLLVRSPDYYDATSVVEINLESTNPAVGDSRNYAVVVNNDPAYFNTQLQMITSPALLRSVITTLHLDHDPVFTRHMSRGGRMLKRLMRLFYVGKTDKQLGLQVTGAPIDPALQPGVTPEELREATRLDPYVKDLANRITLEPVKEARTSLLRDTRLVKVTVRHPNAKMATKLANAVADALVYWNGLHRKEKDSQAAEYLRNRIAELQTDISVGEQSLQAYSSKHGILSLDPGQNTALDRLMALNRELVEAENSRKLAEADYETAKLPDAALSLAEEDSRQIADEQAKIADLRQQRAQLLVTATDKWPPVQEIDQQINTLKSEINAARERASQRVIMNLQTKYLQAKAHEDALRTAFNEQRRTTEIQNEASVEYRLQEQRIRTSKSLLDNLLQRLGQNEVAEAGTTNNIRVVDYAIAMDRPEPAGPYRLLWIVVTLVLSLTMALIGALFLEHLDNTFRTGAEVVSVLRLPALAVIPAIGARFARYLPEFGRRRFDPNGKEPLLWEEKDEHRIRQVTEIYRRLRTSVMLSLGPQRTPTVILVTSALPGEGKTTTVVNLAASMAQAGVRVLVVDGDMRLGRIKTIFRLPKSKGLAEILADPSGKLDLETCIQNHGASNVDVLTAGIPGSNAAELLAKDRLRQVLAQSAGKYDVIMVDSPAMSACTDALNLSLSCDAVLFVVKGGKTARELAGQSCAMLKSVRCRILGVVLNNVVPRAGEMPNYYYYYDSGKAPLSLTASAGR